MSRGNISSLNGFVGKEGNKHPRWSGTKDIPKDFYSQFKRNAQIRNHEFNITIEDLQELWDKQEGKCAYTGQKLEFKRNRNKLKGKHNANSNMASLDRVDNSKPYEKGNIQFLSAPINLMKNTYTESEFFDLIKRIFSHKLKRASQ